VNNPAEVLFWLVGERPTQRLLQAQAAPGAGLGAPAQAL
jgi:hypothetical protein